MNSNSKADQKSLAAIIAINDGMKLEPFTVDFFRAYNRVIKLHYDRIYATEGTSKILGEYFNVDILGHGPFRGDHNVIQKVIERKDAGEGTHVYFFMDWRIDLHERKKENLMAMLIQENVPWFANTTTASSYLELVACIQSHKGIDHIVTGNHKGFEALRGSSVTQ